jgi:hypothetical protein
LQLQNTGNVASEVILTYLPTSGIGTQCTETQTIQPGGSATYALATFHPTAPLPPGASSDCPKGVRFIGSAQVTGNSANQPLVAIGNQLLPGATGGAYRAFSPEAATNQVVLPLIQDRRGNAANRFFTGFNIQNVGSSPATVSCVFSGDDYTISAITLEPGAALNDLQHNKIAENYAGSATCTASETNARITAVVNELGNRADADQLLVYEGIASQP